MQTNRSTKDKQIKHTLKKSCLIWKQKACINHDNNDYNSYASILGKKMTKELATNHIEAILGKPDWFLWFMPYFTFIGL